MFSRPTRALESLCGVSKGGGVSCECWLFPRVQVQAAAAGAMGLIGLAAGAAGLAGASPQLLSVTSAFSVFMVCSAAGAQQPNAHTGTCNVKPSVSPMAVKVVASSMVHVQQE